MSNDTPILVTGAAGNVGSVGRSVVKLLRERDIPVKALVHRLDERSQALSEMGAERPHKWCGHSHGWRFISRRNHDVVGY
jgi:NADPH:quinone reductase-like Zn-dependent oxidoreductase